MTSFTEQTYFFLLLPVVIFLLFFLFLKVFKNKGKKADKGHSEMSFVVDTFHELVAKLKEKEMELEEMRKRAEEHAEEAESYSENIIQSVPSGVVSLDNDLRITKANSAASEILKSDDMVGKSYSEVFHPPITEMIERKKDLKRAEYLYHGSSGEKTWIGLTISPLLNSTGESIGQILIFTDLTELKLLEKQIRLREWLSSLGEISLGIAHELRNPMAVISGYAKLLLRKDAHSKPEIKAIMDEIKVMDRIIDDFLSFARPITQNISEIDLKEMLCNLIKNIVRGREDIKLETEIEDHRINGDEVLLRQALTNLIQNAVEAMPEEGTLTVITQKRDNTFVVKISDTGKGISEDIREKIFLPFYTTKEKGTGLGLSIVQKNITLSGGTITVESSEAGTTFSIHLPEG